MAKCDKQNTCPKCGSNELTYGSSELCDDSIGYEFICDSDKENYNEKIICSSTI